MRRSRSVSSAGLRLVCFSACSLPLLFAVYWSFTAGLGANPIEALTHHTGRWSLRLLLLCLAMTPLQHYLGKPWPIHLRRQLGLWSYFYLCCHFALFLVFDLEFSMRLLSEELLERPYITAGFTALVLLSPLALTSTRGWQRRLKRNWKKLHRLIYPAAVAACLHFLWKTKVSEIEPYAYALILAVLLLARRLK